MFVKKASSSLKEPATRREALRLPVIDAIAETMDLYGANYTFGQLYGIMYFEDRPMTLEEMQGFMNMSKSNMSYAVRSLLDTKMVTKLKEKDERKDLYAAETDFFQTFRNFFAAKLQREVDVMRGALDAAIPELSEVILDAATPDDERKLCLQDLHKLKHAVAYYEWLQRFVNDLQAGVFFENAASEG